MLTKPQFSVALKPQANYVDQLVQHAEKILLSFLALVDFTFEVRCWLWGKFPQIITFDGCMKVACNFVSKDQMAASRDPTTPSTPTA